jgi:hypothetical protein
MPVNWTKEYSVFFYHAQEIWLHYNASRFKSNSEEIRLLCDIVKIPPPDLAFPALIGDPFEVWNFENQRLLLEHLPVSMEESRVSHFLSIPVGPREHFFAVVQIYLVLKLKKMLLTLDKILKDEPGQDSEEFSTARWRLNKVMNLLTRIYLPQLSEEDFESALRIIQGLYGSSFVIGVQCVITVDTVHEIEASFTGMLRCLSEKRVHKDLMDRIHTQENLSHLIRSPVELSVKICLLLESAGNFMAFLEAH